MQKILFTADLHGNMAQYRKVFDYALANATDILIFGGDITPKTPLERRTPQGQRDFLEHELFPALKEFYKQSETHVLFIMGNDDFQSNHDLMVDGQALYGYRMIDQIPYGTASGYTIMGYSWVPYTPFQYKCWEKRDLQSHTIDYRGDTRIEGVRSNGHNLEPYTLVQDFDKTSIEQDLTDISQKIDDMSKLILVSHTPPYETVCDFAKHGKHVGSEALRDFIETKQPYMTLHGHIHETVDLMGAYQQNSGQTVVATAGNDHRPDSPYILDIQLDDVPLIERLQIG